MTTETSGMALITLLVTERGQDENSIGEFSAEAQDFLSSHKWCAGIKSGYLDRGWEGVLGIFYFTIEPEYGADPDIWIVFGDVPPAYIDTLHCKTGEECLESYVSAMRDWLDAARRGDSLDDYIPVLTRGTFQPLDPTEETIDQLARRLDFIEQELMTDEGDESSADF